ncbi:MAG: hypothetical protein JWM41_989 [Gemmatimonadetes bacterium]|nr:hypothetical protein [Gemmatimonadota bacterium]
MPKVYSLTIRNRTALALFTIAVLGLGAVFLTVGLALLLGLVVAGGVLGAGVAAYRRLRGGPRQVPRANLDELDPALEVKQIAPPVVRPHDDND